MATSTHGCLQPTVPLSPPHPRGAGFRRRRAAVEEQLRIFMEVQQECIAPDDVIHQSPTGAPASDAGSTDAQIKGNRSNSVSTAASDEDGRETPETQIGSSTDVGSFASSDAGDSTTSRTSSKSSTLTEASGSGESIALGLFKMGSAAVSKHETPRARSVSVKIHAPPLRSLISRCRTPRAMQLPQEVCGSLAADPWSLNFQSDDPRAERYGGDSKQSGYGEQVRTLTRELLRAKRSSPEAEEFRKQLDELNSAPPSLCGFALCQATPQSARNRTARSMLPTINRR